MPLQLKDLAKLNPIIERIQTGAFDANDVDNLLIKLRPYAGHTPVLLEIAHFVAHPDARHKGLALQSITAFVDSIQYFLDYPYESHSLDLSTPFPAYIRRLLLSQARLSDERRLKAEYKMSHDTLIRKIENNFIIDKKSNTCSIRSNKAGKELLAALRFIINVIHSKPAFHLRDFHSELKELMRAQKVSFDEAAWNTQEDRISLAILCLVSNTKFSLENEGEAGCKIQTESHLRILSGQRRLPTGIISSKPDSFGKLAIHAIAKVKSGNKPPLSNTFPLIDSDLDPHAHCDQQLFIRKEGTGELEGCNIEVINWADDMSISKDFKLIRTDSLD